MHAKYKFDEGGTAPQEKLVLSDNPLGFVPVIGDVLQAGDAVLEAKRGNYASAALTAGLLLVPNIVEKPLKAVGKAVVRSADDVAALSKGIKRTQKQMSNLAKYVRRTAFDLPEETIEDFAQAGLTKMDVSRLLERGWDVDQIFEALGRHGILPSAKPNSNIRAKLLTAEMLERGMKPNSKSRLSFLKELMDAGQPIYKDRFGTPYTQKEWARKFPNVDPTDYRMSWDEIVKYYEII